jgi:putative hydrolase of the HAD superfamily
MTIKAIVFDMDDTLYEEKQYVISGFKAVDQYIIEHYGVTGFFETAIILFHSGIRELIFNKALDQLGVEYGDHTIKILVNCYRSHMPDIHLAEDAKWVLEHLSSEVKLALLSDGYLNAQQQKVHALKLTDRFEVIVLSDEYGRENWKPSPLVYEEVSRKLQINHDQCMYIGDNVKKDFVTAKRLGWTTVHIQRENGEYVNADVTPEYEAHYRIDSLRKLPDLYACEHMFNKDGESVHVS